MILGDSIYPCESPLSTPYRRNQIRAAPQQNQPSMVQFNEIHKSHRVYVEHVIGQLKTCRCIGRIFRHQRQHMARLVELCVALSQRRVELYESI